jgi:periplasmic nitrate reductase NapD
MEQEVHIAGIVVHAMPEQLATIKARIVSLPAAEIHAVSNDGKLVVTLETESTKRILDYMDAIRALPGVVDVALVYQHAEPLTALNQEIPS